MTRYRDISLQYKLLIWVIPLLILTVGLTGLYSYYIAANEIVDKIRQAQSHMAAKTTNQLDFITSGTISTGNFLFLNPSLQHLVTTSDTLEVREQIYKSLLPLMVSSESFQSLLVYRLSTGQEDNGPFAITQTGIASAASFAEFQETRFFKNIMKSAGEPIWDMLSPEDHLLHGDRHYKLVMIKPFKDFNTYKRIGVLMIGIDADQLSNNLFRKENNAYQLVINDDGVILASTELDNLGEHIGDLPYFQSAEPALSKDDALSYLLDRDDLVVSQTTSPLTGWHSLVIQNKKDLLKELDYIKSITVLIMAVFTLVMILCTWLIAKIITNPVKTLILSMKQLQLGDFSQRVNFSGNDEIGQLGYWYDTMVKRVKTLIDDVYTSHLKQKEAELKTLQSQINPHFLYNTLNMISWTAMQKNERDIAEMVQSLSQVFRLSLNNGQDNTTLHQEVEFIENYLFLQKKRFTTRFHFSVTLDEEISHFQVPKLLLQPLVENAIIHAIEPLEGSGMIAVACYAEESWIVLEVVDNGKGMTPERVKQILCHPKPVTPSIGHSGLALSNIRERLNLSFELTEFHIESTLGLGTRIQIRIHRGGN
ncbi:sensor histidine kinase [Paenibacillus sp. sgz500992]|uniref:sensor histidine kinase n=1 Tax=Paenibacillus sp. sgz500992 TaxID=3242476 RepID=UPI0036D330F5